MRIALLAALLVATACTTQEKVPRPNIDEGKLKDSTEHQDKGKGHKLKDSVVVDSAGAMLYRHASYGARLVAGDTSTYTISYSISNALGALDTVQVWLRRDSALNVPKISTSKYFRTLKGSATFKVLKIFNATAQYSACVRVRSNTVKSNDLCQSWKTNYLRVVPPPVVDSVKVDSTLAVAKLDLKPDKVSVETGQSQQFCAFVVFKDGKVAIRAPDRITDTCPAEYLKLPLAVRAVTQAQQQIADTLCVKWDVTGGTISAEVCGPPNPLVGHPA